MPKPAMKMSRLKKADFVKTGKIPPPPKCPPTLTAELQATTPEPNMVEFTKPEQATKVIWLRAQGKTYKAIAAETKLNFDTVMRLCWRHEDTIETHRKRFSARYAQIADLYSDVLAEKAERLIENPDLADGISPDRLALTIGIMTDHASKLAGMATQTIEVRKGASVEDAKRLIEEAKARVAAKAAETVVDAEIVE